MNQRKIYPVGVIHLSYKKNIPIQGRFKDKIEAWIELKEKFVTADLEGA